MIDLYAIHEEKVQNGFLSIHPSRWLGCCKFGITGVFNFPSPERRVQDQPMCNIDKQTIRYFSELRDLDLRGKMYLKHGHYFASLDVADRYAKHVPRKSMYECAILDMLSVSHPDGHIEVHTPVGYIDFLHPTAIVEVKCLAKWKHALGQILAYSTYYPDRTKIIHLYAQDIEMPELKEQLLVCRSFNVAIEYQNILSDERGLVSKIGTPIGTM